MKKYFIAAIAAIAISVNVANAQNEAQPEPLMMHTGANVHAEWVAKKDSLGNIVSREQMSYKLITGLEFIVGGEYRNFDSFSSAQPTLGVGYHGPNWVLRGYLGYTLAQYRDPESNKKGQTYGSLTGVFTIGYKVWSSTGTRSLEKNYLLVSGRFEYTNRRNAKATEVATLESYKVEEYRNQGSAYGIGGEVAFGFTNAKKALRGEIFAYGEYSRDYKWSTGNKGCVAFGIGGRVTLVTSKRHYNTKASQEARDAYYQATGKRL